MRVDHHRNGFHRTSRTTAVGLTLGLVGGFLTAAPAFADGAATIGAPVVSATVDPPAGTVSCVLEGNVPTVTPGSVCSFTISPSPSDTAIPTGYTILSITGYPTTVTAAAPGNGDSFDAATGVATVSLIMDSWYNSFTVSENNPAGGPGPSTPLQFQGALRPPSTTGDVNEDGVPDLLFAPTAGSALPPGLWLATGAADGTVNPTGIDLGGSYPSPDGYKSTWDGVDAVPGNFCGDNDTDVLVYDPGAYDAGTNPDGGGGTVFCGDGSRDALDIGYNPLFSSPEIPAETFQDSAGNDATQVVEAGNTSGAGTGLDDVLATIGNQLYLLRSFAAGAYSTDAEFGDPICSYGDCAFLSQTPTPDGTFDWDSWTLATTQTPAGTAMYLWNPTTGALDLWTGLTATDAANDGDLSNYTVLKYTQYTIAAGGSKTKWNKGKALELRASDLDGATVPNLWAVDPATGKITTYLAGLGANGVTLAAAGAAQTLLTPANSWVLDDRGSGSAGTAQDGGSADTANTQSAQPGAALPLTGDAGVTWNTGDQFSPDAAFDGSTGNLASRGPAVTLGADFSVSAWVKPTAAGGTVFSQSGTADSAFLLSAGTNGKWEFGLNTGGTTSATYAEKSAGAYQLGSWAHVTLVYTSSTDTLSLFVGDSKVGSVTTATPPATAGNFVVGAGQSGSALGSFFTGQMAHVTTWNSALTGAQIAKIS